MEIYFTHMVTLLHAIILIEMFLNYSHLRQCLALFSVTEGWLLLDIGLLSCYSSHNEYKCRISNEFSFYTMYYEMSYVFYIPEPLAR